MQDTSLRQTSILVAALLVIAAAAAAPAVEVPDRSADTRPNILLIVSDDQSPATFPSRPAAMPWLQRQVFRLGGQWIWFPNAVISTPLCCPSRATILTGRTSWHTGVETNADGGKLDERRTLPARLHEAGYWTALVGKYLNHYPFGRLPYIPAGWDRWVAKRNLVPQTTYANYPLVEGTVPTFVARSEHGYATDLLADRAVDVLAQAPTDRPWFVLFAPSAPHAPWTPPRRYAHVFDDVRLRGPSEHVLNDVRGKPRWIRNRRPIDSARRRQLLAQRGREREALLGLDDAVRRVVAAVAARGELDDTVILYLTDNGYAFGEHRWQGKRCPYEPCIDTPFAIRAPGLIGFESSDLVSNLDVAPTIAELAGVDLGKVDGISLAPLLEDQRVKVRPGVPIGYAGDVGVPPWRGFRTPGLAYIENADGTVELYDLAGALGPPDPDQLDNRATDPAYADARQSLARFLDRWGPPARTPR